MVIHDTSRPNPYLTFLIVSTPTDRRRRIPSDRPRSDHRCLARSVRRPLSLNRDCNPNPQSHGTPTTTDERLRAPSTTDERLRAPSTTVTISVRLFRPSTTATCSPANSAPPIAHSRSSRFAAISPNRYSSRLASAVPCSSLARAITPPSTSTAGVRLL
ncbi:cysteine proteinases superfamily protein [Striga asiatica]|uniref:Cysteine proteinases superfamily protein n=1 Tax=Striga asiatica TaxID=4170 RepID=A0A5A7QKU9_STRAF|nr:cysteine proteinases superfamily protein [Striga asiatica]